MSFFDRFTKRTKASKDVDQGKSIPIVINCWNYKKFHGDLLEIDVIVSCIDALARNLAKMRLTAIRRVKDSVAITDFSSDIARVLRKPNPYMTMYDFIYKVAALYYASNNAFIWPEYNDKGELINLWPINYRGFKVYEVDGIKIARFEMERNHFYTIPYKDLIPLRNHYFNDALFGDENYPFKPIAELMHAQNQGIIEGIKNSALIRGLLIASGVLKEEDIKAARERFIEENLNAKNNGGVMIIDGKFDYKSLESKPYIIDADTRAKTKEEAFEYFGVNEEFLQNNFTAEKYEAIYEGRLEPFAIMLTDALTAFLFTEREVSFGNEIVANMSKVKYQSINSVVNIVNATKELGLFTRDEYREMLGYEPLGPERGGDEIMIATNNYQSDQSAGAAAEGDTNE